MTPFRGQVVVAANPGISEFFIGPADDTADLVYLFPHEDTVVLGGTEVADDWNTEPVPALADRILRDCTVGRATAARRTEILGHRVGLRPYRPQIRLEAEPAGGPRRAPAHGIRSSCTTTATAAPGSPCPGAAPAKPPRWSPAGCDLQ